MNFLRRTLFVVVAMFALSQSADAQLFVTQYDTVKAAVSYSSSLVNAITDISSDTIVKHIQIQWKVVATDFPTNWSGGNLSISDNQYSYSNTAGLLWNGTSGTTITSGNYDSGVQGDFHMQLDLTSADAGTHYLTVNLKDATGYNKNITFVVTKSYLGIPVAKNIEDINVYPNPARSNVNVVFNENAGVKTIGIYNLIGKAEKTFLVSGNSAMLDLTNIPEGIYFIRLMNAQGNVIATRKFTHQ